MSKLIAGGLVFLVCYGILTVVTLPVSVPVFTLSVVAGVVAGLIVG